MKEGYDLSEGKRGAVVPVPPSKERITILPDKDIVEYFHTEVCRAGSAPTHRSTPAFRASLFRQPCGRQGGTLWLTHPSPAL
jgi:hypothetical protein